MELRSAIDPAPEAVGRIRESIRDDAKAATGEGGIIRPGFSSEVDELSRASTEGREWLVKLEANERERTGIKSLKVGFNQVFGYYIEVTHANAHLVPVDYTRKQTLANAERYITPELKELESKILGAEERLARLEAAIFQQIVDEWPGIYPGYSALLAQWLRRMCWRRSPRKRGRPATCGLWWTMDALLGSVKRATRCWKGSWGRLDTCPAT